MWQRKNNHPKSTQDGIAKYFSEVFGKTVGHLTVSNILKNKQKWAGATKDTTNRI